MTTILALYCLTLPSQYTVVSTHERIASVYDDYYIGRTTASGEVFSQELPTCASNEFALGTKVRVSKGESQVFLRVDDRMHRRYDGIRINLPRRYWRMLGDKPDGLHEVTVEVISYE